MNPQEPKNPSQQWIESFIHPSLRKTQHYHLEQPTGITVKLDQNECPFDWPEQVKKEIGDRLAAQDWNRYPDPFGDRLTELLAQHLGVQPQNLLTGPGSNYLISLLFDTLGHHIAGDVVVLRPSFALFEGQCHYSGLGYKTWPLNDDLEFDTALLPAMPAGSVLIFASPNNPTGSSISEEQLRSILDQNPDSLIIADEAYYEFATNNFQSLLAEYSNLLIMRTLSKTMGAAGLRLGYLLGSTALIGELQKRRLPYLLNHFSLIAAEVMLSSAEMTKFVEEHVAMIRSERSRVLSELQSWAERFDVTIKASDANFFLFKMANCAAYYQHLQGEGIIIRDISKGPGLAGCLRVSIGKPEENNALIAATLAFKGP